jgi:hypothetical protein
MKNTEKLGAALKKNIERRKTAKASKEDDMSKKDQKE